MLARARMRRAAEKSVHESDITDGYVDVIPRQTTRFGCHEGLPITTATGAPFRPSTSPSTAAAASLQSKGTHNSSRVGETLVGERLSARGVRGGLRDSDGGDGQESRKSDAGHGPRIKRVLGEEAGGQGQRVTVGDDGRGRKNDILTTRSTSTYIYNPRLPFQTPPKAQHPYIPRFYNWRSAALRPASTERTDPRTRAVHVTVARGRVLKARTQLSSQEYINSAHRLPPLLQPFLSTTTTTARAFPSEPRPPVAMVKTVTGPSDGSMRLDASH